MAQDNPVSRRTALKLTGAAASTALIAGCSGGGNGNGNGNGNGGGSDGVEIESGTEVDFSGQTTHWEGLAPSDIEGEQNPTLILQEGEEYTFGWSEGDGANHNLEIRDSNGEIVDDLTTGDPVAEPGDDQTLTFEANSDMAVYRCDPHPQMEGEIVVE
ncbi:plastocyanin/azurin family copper-binding protein [Haloarchaeobius amylolyticus]|uniref:Plastocyanin/azurin family copper-binding protein n=1 Tax=Haloarchaeobius amylolyticus TaxID=1198296 RepID=A0ABD6BJU8_9EURY